jgi:hypothetical protein
MTVTLIYLESFGSTRTSFLPSMTLNRKVLCLAGEIITLTEPNHRLRKIDLQGEAEALHQFQLRSSWKK